MRFIVSGAEDVTCHNDRAYSRYVECERGALIEYSEALKVDYQSLRIIDLDRNKSYQLFELTEIVDTVHMIDSGV